jgi:hypothetical protein
MNMPQQTRLVPPVVMTSWWAEYRTEIVIVLIGFGVMNLIFFPSAFRDGFTVDRAAAGQLGDFVGGYVGTAFVLLSVVLLFITLKKQRLTAQEQSFETKYFELIKIHRDNVDELQLKGTRGRKIFVLILREFRLILSVTRRIALQCKQDLDQQQLLHIAYYCLYFGTGPNSSRMLKLSLAKFDADFITALENELGKEEVKLEAKLQRKLPYKPFEGHQSRLGHYYRHLYQTVCYVDKQKLNLDKYEFVKTIRAQLSTHEQALLLLNSLTPIGRNWWIKDLIVKYRMVQNLPREFFEPQSEFNVNNIFERGYFEWEEVEQATSN